MPKTINSYKKASQLVIAFGILALATNFIQIQFFSFYELAADGVSYTKDWSSLIQGLIYFGIAILLAYFIRRENKFAAIFAGAMAALIGLSTFWLQLFRDGQNLITAFDTVAPGASLIDAFTVMYSFYFVVSLLSITLCQSSIWQEITLLINIK
ncbi:MAG: hypothetical protein MUF19_01940 [Candidatus Pacebacteria bacterium]|nr:hypothetical protein [Candidatus Paceibacterota bacterium]